MGRAWKFGDNISTDLIAAGRYYHLRSNLPELAKHVLEDARADFAPGVKAGDVVVGGRNFGKGSSREHAPVIIKLAGTRAVLAKSFARIFYRNAINIGLPAIVVDTDRIDEGDDLDVDLEKGVVHDRTKGIDLTFPSLPPVMARILEEGGLVEYIKNHGDLVVDAP
ncbi:MAG: 3-isopropylmalate dehydratase [Euryarchaeota archaeon RBG_19FT_COMBO_69_17]|nr:MAG: 3-isopropylmalate dehydratase [Euryarchaeota archaeon RBG_19FT_COMBO_69_17]